MLRSLLWTAGLLVLGPITLALPSIIISGALTACTKAAGHPHRTRSIAGTVGAFAIMGCTALLGAALLALYGRAMVSEEGLPSWLIYPAAWLVGLSPLVIAFGEMGSTGNPDSARAIRAGYYASLAIAAILGIAMLASERVAISVTTTLGVAFDVVSRGLSSVSTLLWWGFLAFVGWIAWSIARHAFAETRTPWRTAAKAAGWIVGLAVLAAYGVGQKSDPDCAPDPLYGGCSSYSVPTSGAERFRAAGAILLLIGAPVALAGWSTRARFPDPDQSMSETR